MFEKKTISTNAKEDIKGASGIFSYEFIKSTKHKMNLEMSKRARYETVKVKNDLPTI